MNIVTIPGASPEIIRLRRLISFSITDSRDKNHFRSFSGLIINGGMSEWTTEILLI